MDTLALFLPTFKRTPGRICLLFLNRVPMSYSFLMTFVFISV
nr:MAG TPA: hypothetical protein [Caudoviricetes sp.]